MEAVSPSPAFCHNFLLTCRYIQGSLFILTIYLLFILLLLLLPMFEAKWWL